MDIAYSLDSGSLVQNAEVKGVIDTMSAISYQLRRFKSLQFLPNSVQLEISNDSHASSPGYVCEISLRSH